MAEILDEAHHGEQHIRPEADDAARPQQGASDGGAADGPLTGVRVIELGSLLAGPFAGRLLADLGAEVIKVEAPDKPDGYREWGRGVYHGRGLAWPVLSRNKKLITINLREREGQELLLDLAACSDAVVENFRPGTLERWNVGPEQLEARNPGIVTARVSGFGQTGPYSTRPGFAVVAEAMGGLRYISGFPDGPPPRVHLSLGDTLASMWAVIGVISALYARDGRPAVGRGQVVDVSLLEACFAMLESTVAEYDRLGSIREPQGTNLDGIAPSNIFRTSDDRWIVIGANADNVFGRLCEAIGEPKLAEDSRFNTHRARGEHQDEIEGIVAAWVAARTTTEVVEAMEHHGVISGPVYTVADIFKDEHFWARDMLVEHVDPDFGAYIGPGIVPKLTGTPGRVRWSARWTLGSDNEEIFRGLLGVSPEQLAGLKARGIV